MPDTTTTLLTRVLRRIVDREHDPILLERSIGVARNLLAALDKGWVPETAEDIETRAHTPGIWSE